MRVLPRSHGIAFRQTEHQICRDVIQIVNERQAGAPRDIFSDIEIKRAEQVIELATLSPGSNKIFKRNEYKE